MNITARPQALIAIASTVRSPCPMITQPSSFPIIFLAAPPPHLSVGPLPLVSRSPSVYFSVCLILCESLETRALSEEDACFCVAGPVILGPRPLTVSCPFHARIALSIKTETNKYISMDVRSTTENDQYTAHREREYRNSFT